MHTIQTFRILLLALGLWIGAASVTTADADVSALQTLESVYHNVRKFTMDNGMTVLLKESRRAPAVAIQVWVGAGSIHEDNYLGAGLSHYIEHMIFKGTTNRAPNDISREIDEAGGWINAYTTYDRTVFLTALPSTRWETGLVVMADALMHPLFPEEEWEREKKVILREMAMGEDDPTRVLGKLHSATAYREHPFRHPVIGYEEVFRRMTRDDLLAYFERHYRPGNMIVAIAGDIDVDDAEAAVRRVFGPFKRRPAKPNVVPREPTQTAARFVRKTGAYELSRMAWSYHTVPMNHPDAPALDVLSVLAGQGQSSRLYRRLKDEERLIYSVYTYSHTPKDPGEFALSISFAPENEKALLDTIEDVMADWRRKAPFSKQELAKARRRMLAGEVHQLASVGGLARSLASGEYYAGDPAFTLDYLQSISDVTRSDIQRVIRTYFRPENRTVAVLAPETDAPIEAAENDDAAVIDIPRPERFTLPNGAVVLLGQDPSLPLVYFHAVLKGGLLSEQADTIGITRLMSELLTRGAGKRSARNIADLVEGAGGSLSAFSSRSIWGLSAHCLSDDAECFTELLADCLMRPRFDPAEIEKQRADQLAAIRAQRERPMYLARTVLNQALFPGHPYRWDEKGTEETVESINREDLVAFHERALKAGDFVIAVFGDFDPDAMLEHLKEQFGDLPAGPAPVADIPTPEPKAVELTDTAPKAQAVLLVGYPGIDVLDPRREAVSIIQTALSGMSSQLFIELREKRGLVYFTGASSFMGLDPGLFALYAGTRKDAIDQAQQLMIDQIERYRDEGLTPREMKRATAKTIGSWRMGLQNRAGLAAACALNELLGLGADFHFRTEERIRAVTSEDVRATAQSLFDPEHRVVSRILPEAP